MKAHELRSVGVLLVVLLAVSVPAIAQDDVTAVDAGDGADAKKTKFLIELSYDYSKALESDYRIGAKFDGDSNTFRTLAFPEESDSGSGHRLGWILPGDAGELQWSYRSISLESRAVVSSPGQFIYQITETWPLAAGVADDGFADAINARSAFRTREGALTWRLPVMQSERVFINFAVGVRKLIHNRNQEITYFALDAGLPPLITPSGDDLGYLFPIPDVMTSRSEYSASGLQVGVDSRMPFFQDRLQFEASASLSVLRGTARAGYSSRTAFYVFDDGNVLAPIAFEDVLALIRADDINQLNQSATFFQLENSSKSTLSPAFDVSAGLRFRVWRGVELAVGARVTVVKDALYEIRPLAPSPGLTSQLQLVGSQEQWHDVVYESAYGSVGYRF